MAETIEFGTKILKAIPKGLGIGALFYLIAAGINGVLGIWEVPAEIVLAVVGFAIAIADGIT